jgi:hypothetical protein
MGHRDQQFIPSKSRGKTPYQKKKKTEGEGGLGNSAPHRVVQMDVQMDCCDVTKGLLMCVN